jgi:feruloyl-CoA synthase
MGERIVMTTGLGMTESGPFGLFVTSPHVQAGDLGVPTPGLDSSWWTPTARPRCATAAPTSHPATGARLRRPPRILTTRASFAPATRCKWIDETDVHLGLKFDGRIAEDFKLATGTFVSVGPLRAKIIAAGAPYIQDVVLTGINMKEVGAMVFPTPRPCASLPVWMPTPLADVLASAPVHHFLPGRGGQAGRDCHRQCQSHCPAVPAGRAADH